MTLFPTIQEPYWGCYKALGAWIGDFSFSTVCRVVLLCPTMSENMAHALGFRLLPPDLSFSVLFCSVLARLLHGCCTLYGGFQCG